MRRLTRGIVTALFLSFGVVLASNPAHAITPKRFEYTITSESPTLSVTPAGVNCSDRQNWYPTAKQYEALDLEVSETGYYFFTENRNPYIDGQIIFFSTPFNESDVSNCLKTIDDFNSIRLQAGVTYSVVATSFSSPTVAAEYVYDVTGPGEIAFGHNPVQSAVDVLSVIVDSDTPATLVARPVSSALGADLSGTVNFTVNGSAVGSATVSPATGTATFDAGLLPAGRHTVTADYSGVFGKTRPSSGESSVTVQKTVTTTSLTVSPAAITAGDEATYTAQVSGNRPTGSVGFYSGPTLVGISPLVEGVAQVTVSPDAGTYSVTANYFGDSNYTASTAAPATLTVTEKPVPEPEPEPNPEPEPEPKPGATAKPESTQAPVKAEAALANTGSTQDGWLAAAGLLLVAGTSVLILRRKSSR